VVSARYPPVRQHRYRDAADEERADEHDGDAPEIRCVDKENDALVADQQSWHMPLAQRVHRVEISGNAAER
jgi:hypothetical protein